VASKTIIVADIEEIEYSEDENKYPFKSEFRLTELVEENDSNNS